MGKKNTGYEEVNKKPRDNGRFAPKDKVPMKHLGFRVPAYVVDWLEAEAERKGLSKTDIARELLQRQIPA